MHHNWIVAERAEQSCCLSLLVRACRYTAGVYSHIPGGLAALPKFDDTDFKIPANVVKGECSVCIWPFVLALHLPCFQSAAQASKGWTLQQMGKDPACLFWHTYSTVDTPSKGIVLH